MREPAKTQLRSKDRGEDLPVPGSEVEPAGETRFPSPFERTIQAAREYAAAARAPNTLRAYTSDIEDFKTYCRIELGGAQVMPATPETVTLYITDMAREVPEGRGLKVSTIECRLASISAWHKRAAPITVGVLQRMLEVIRIHDKKTGAIVPSALRDWTLLLTGLCRVFPAARDLRLASIRPRVLRGAGPCGAGSDLKDRCRG